MNQEKRPGLWESFFKSQTSSLVATVSDYGIFSLLYLILHVNYAIASFCGNIVGAVVSFNLGRNWAFKSQSGKLTSQIGKYAITSLVSSLINTGLIVIFVEKFSIPPLPAKLICAFLVGIFFNFVMFRYFVFKVK